MKKMYRIKKTNEIDALFKTKTRVSSKYFNIFYQPSKQNNFRFAISIGKKYGNSVQRNLMKRRLREIIKSNQESIGIIDFVITVKPNSIDLDFTQIKADIEKLLKKSKIIN